MSKDEINFIEEPIYQSFINKQPFNLSVSKLPDIFQKLGNNISSKSIEPMVYLQNRNNLFFLVEKDGRPCHKPIFPTSSVSSNCKYINKNEITGYLYVIMNYYDEKLDIDNNIIKELKKKYKTELNIFVYYYLFVLFSKINQYKFISLKEILNFYEKLKKHVQFPDDKKKNEIINSICAEYLSIILNLYQLDNIEKEEEEEEEEENNTNINLDDIFLLTIYSFERDMFNGIIDKKYILLKTYYNKYNQLLKNNDKYKLILKKYCKYILYENRYIIDNFNKNDSYSLNDFIIIKNKYEHFMELCFKYFPNNIEELNNIITSNLREFDLIFNFEISLNSKEYSILIEYYNDNYYEFYDKLINCLLVLFKSLKYPIGTITNTLLILLDLIHLSKRNLSYNFLIKFLLLIEEYIKSNGIITKIFQIPIVDLKLLIFLHDIWDILIDKKIPYYENEYYIIKELFQYFYELLRNFSTPNDSIKFLYYSFLLKKAKNKIIWTRNEYEAKKYYLTVYKDLNNQNNPKLKLLYDYSINILKQFEKKLRIKLID